MRQVDAPIKRSQKNMAISPHQKIMSSPSSRNVLKIEEIKKLAPNLIQTTLIHAGSKEDGNIQHEFTKIVKKQAHKKSHDILGSCSEDLLKDISKSAKFRVDNVIKNSNKRFGIIKKDKEYRFNQNLDGVKRLNTYFDKSEMMKIKALTPSKNENDKKIEVKTTNKNQRIEFPQITKFRSGTHRIKSLSNTILEESNLEKLESLKRELINVQHTYSTSSLARSLSDQVLRKAKNRSKIISMMDSYSANQARKISESINDQNNSNNIILIDRHNDHDSEDEQLDDEELIEERKMIQRAREEVERDWESHQQLRFDFKRRQLSQSLIDCLETLRLNRESNGALNENFQTEFFRLLEERVKEVKRAREPRNLNKKEQVKDTPENLQTHLQSQNIERLDSDVRIVGDLNSHKSCSIKAINLLKSPTKRILKHYSVPQTEENNKSGADSFVIQSREKISFLDLASMTLTLKQTSSNPEKKKTTINFLEKPLRIQIPQKNGSNCFNVSIVSAMRTPVLNSNQIEFKEK